MARQKAASSVPPKKPKVKTSQPAKPKKVFPSAEFIDDSDASKEENTKKAKKQSSKTTKSAPPVTKAAPPKVASSTSKLSKKCKFPSPSLAKEGSTRSESKEESSSNSGSERGSEDSSPAQDGNPTPSKPKQNATQTTKAKPALAMSVEKPQLNKSRDDESALRRRSASPSEDEEDSEGSEGESESGTESGSSDPTSLQSPGEKNPIRNAGASLQEEEEISFKPPSGFDLASIVVHPSSQAAEIFSPANLAGKEIWHITAPSSVPVSSINEVSRQNITSRSSILTYESSNYSLIPESSANKQILLLPSARNNEYKSCNAAIVQTLHLQQLVDVPNYLLSPTESSNQMTTTPQAYKRAPRQQPEGLKMRYHPFGVADLSENELPSEKVAKAPQFRVPGAVDATPAKKRKRSSIDHEEQNPSISSAKAKAKKLRGEQETTLDEHDDAMDVDTVKQPSSNDKKAPSLTTNGISESPASKNAKSKKIKPNSIEEKIELPSHDFLPRGIAEEAETIMPEEVITNGVSAIEIAAPEEKKAKRRRRKEAAEAAEQEKLAAKEERIEKMLEVGSESGQLEGRLVTPGKSSPQKRGVVGDGKVAEVQESKERRRRKEEKRRRKREAGMV